MTFSEELARYALSIRYEAADKRAAQEAKAHFADGIACMLAGADAKPAQLMEQLLGQYGGAPVCTVVGHGGLKTDPCNAAMMNAVASHYYDIDDISKNARGHSTSVVLPVVLALGERENISGRRALDAYLCGIETASIIGRGINAENMDKGWNPTSMISIFGATAAAAMILGLSEEQLADAFGFAASEAGGFKANYGTMTKDLSVGRVSAKAVLAAELARLGATSSRRIFEGDDGYSQAVTLGGMDFAAMTAAMEQHLSDFTAPGIIMKPQPSCRGVHNGIDGILQLMEQHHFTAEDVADILFKVQPVVKNADRYPRPSKPEEGKFSLAYCAAVALLHGRVEIDDFIGEEIKDPAIYEIINKTREEIDNSFTDAKSGIETVVTLKDGSVCSYRGCYAKGDPNNPMTQKEMDDKFMHLAQRTLSPQAAAQVKAALDGLEDLEHLRQLVNLLA